MKTKKEIRMLPLQELRIEDEEAGEIIGHASVFNSWSELLGGLFPFKEIVRKGAFIDTIKVDDIRALFNHDPNFVLGRNKAGTLELEEDDIGLKVRILLPNTQTAKDLVENIRRGDISQMSIGFIVEDDSWGTKDGIDIREIKKVQLFDVSIVTFPAYTQTDCGVRAMEEYNNYKSKRDEAKDSKERAKAKQKLQSIRTKFI
jgi:phage prohead protease, HK97 family|nr:MAG TPA: prohead serine protease [Caudoviricetes sp.]